MKKRVVVVPQRNDKNNFSEAERVKQGQQGRCEIQIIPTCQRNDNVHYSTQFQVRAYLLR